MSIFNSEKFVNFLYFANFVLPENGMMELDEENDKEVVKISVGEHLFTVSKGFYNKFCKIVEKEELETLLQLLEEPDSGFKYQPKLSDETDKFLLPSLAEDLKEIPENIKDVIQQRISGIVNITGIQVKKLAEIINKRMEEVAKDGNIIKDFDAYLTLDVTYEKGFKLFLCFDKIKPIFEKPEDIQILRTPMSKEDIKLYIGDYYKEIQQMFKLIEDSVNSLLECKAVSFSKLARDFAISLVNGSIVQHLLNITPVFISFGGVDNWRLFGGTTPNSEVCHKLLDQESEYLVNYLKNIPLTEGVDYYAVDVKQLAVYGRNNLNKTVSGPLPEHSDTLTLRYSDGFLDSFLLRLKQCDNKICFTY